MMDRGHQQHELIAADARDRIDRAYQSRQAARDLLQQLIARGVSQRIVDELEAVEIANHHRERAPVAIGVRHRLRQAIVQEHAIRQARERIVSREMAQLPVGGLQTSGAHADHLFEIDHLSRTRRSFVPLARQCGGALQDLDRLGGLAQDQQLVRVIQALDDFRPVVVGMRGADHDLQRPDRLSTARSMVSRPSQPGGMRMSTKAMA